MDLKRLAVVVFGGVLLAGGAGVGQQQRPVGEGRFDVFPGLEIKVFASEPMLVKPTNLTVDERGRVWVLEGHNYRNANLNNRRAEGDRILILEDTDGNGVADKSTVFYQGNDVNAALGIAVLGSKVIVSAYQNIFVFTNENDSVAKKDVLFTAQTGNHDHSTHAFVFGPDGKLYWNAGNAVSSVMDKDGKNVVDVRGKEVTAQNYRQGRAFRTNEDGTGLEVLGYNFRNNYELAVDSFGSVWQTDNDDDGNQSTRVNYVMEGGNFGYQDELTGAAWRTARYDLEKATPQRHWYQQSPGVVPNVRVNGAGSPAGLVLYEGTLLPAPFRGQMIHAEPGWNVVRAYPVRAVGAGYDADILNFAQNIDNPWFRPSDVAVAPDGSLFISDWADPGVGGHRQGDQSMGRVYRVSPPGFAYRTVRPNVTSIAGAIEALKSPNQSTTYLAWHRIHAAGVEAETSLRALFESDTADARHRARALWLLTKIAGRGDYWVRQGLTNRDVNLRVTAIRAARQLSGSPLPYVEIAAKDGAPQLRREAAVALRGQAGERGAELWADLAAGYAGGDRWLLEALGIGAEGQWDRYFGTWQKRVGARWNTVGGREIVWRSRAQAAIPLLVELINSPTTTTNERPRYFRALDFHPPDRKQEVLRSLVSAGLGEAGSGEIAALALFGLEVDVANPDADVRGAIDRALATSKGTQAFVDLVARFQLRARASELVEMALADPEGNIGQEAARLALNLVVPPPARGRGAGGRQGVPPANPSSLPAIPATPPPTQTPPGGAAPAVPSAQTVLGARGSGADALPGQGRGGGVPVDPEPVVRLFGSALNSADLTVVRKTLLVLGTADHAAARLVIQNVILDARRSESVRSEAIRSLGLTRGGETMLLAMAGDGSLPAALKPAVAMVLFSSYSAETRASARKFLQPPEALAANGTTVRTIGELALRSGDAEAGSGMFRRVCAICHKIDGQGTDFGPDLSQVGGKFAKQALYAKILDPNSGVAFGYETTVLKLKNGETAAGHVVNETNQQVTLKSIGAVTTRYDVSQIASREVLPGSLMPAGLVGAMSETDLVNLVEYLSRRRAQAAR